MKANVQLNVWSDEHKTETDTSVLQCQQLSINIK